jgi:hypothetical protein
MMLTRRKAIGIFPTQHGGYFGFSQFLVWLKHAWGV